MHPEILASIYFFLIKSETFALSRDKIKGCELSDGIISHGTCGVCQQESGSDVSAEPQFGSQTLDELCARTAAEVLLELSDRKPSLQGSSECLNSSRLPLNTSNTK